MPCPIVQTRIHADGLKLVTEICEITGASTSSVVAAMLDYLALYEKDKVTDFMLHNVEFYTKNFRFRRTPPK